MYLGNVLLNFIHKECKNNNGSERDQCGLSTGVSSAVEQLHQQQLSNLAVAVGSRAGSNFFQAAVAAAASNNICSQNPTNVTPSTSKRSKKSSSTLPLASDAAQVQSSEVEPNLIGDTTTVISQGYCPCCHYHSHLQQQQLQQQQQEQTSAMNQQQQQHVMLAAAAVAAQQQQQQQQQQQTQQAQNFHQGYYNYAANFSPYFSSQRHYVSKLFLWSFVTFFPV